MAQQQGCGRSVAKALLRVAGHITSPLARTKSWMVARLSSCLVIAIIALATAHMATASGTASGIDVAVDATLLERFNERVLVHVESLEGTSAAEWRSFSFSMENILKKVRRNFTLYLKQAEEFRVEIGKVDPVADGGMCLQCDELLYYVLVLCTKAKGLARTIVEATATLNGFEAW